MYRERRTRASTTNNIIEFLFLDDLSSYVVELLRVFLLLPHRRFWRVTITDFHFLVCIDRSFFLQMELVKGLGSLIERRDGGAQSPELESCNCHYYESLLTKSRGKISSIEGKTATEKLFHRWWTRKTSGRRGEDHYVMLIIDDYQINRLIHFFKFPVSRDKTIARN
jgi:hypothetical protein